MYSLQRIESSGFTLDDAISLSALPDLAASGRLSEHMVSMADALPVLPVYAVGEDLSEKIRCGKYIAIRDLLSHNSIDKNGIPDAHMKIVDQAGNLIAILNYNRRKKQLDYCCVFP